MAENFVEQLDKPSKSLETRAGYTRRFLEEQEISNADFIKKAGDLGVTVAEEDMMDDKKLVTKVYEIQKALKFNEIDLKEGTDGMFGPYTLEKLEEFISSKAERKDVSADVADSAKAKSIGAGAPAPSGDASAVASEPAKADAEAAKPQAPIQQVEAQSTPTKLDKILTKFPGKSEVVRLPGNGNRQVVIYIPEGFDPSKPVEIDYHFHGMHGNWIDVPFPKLEGTGKHYHTGDIGAGSNRISQAITAAQKHKNMILVYPSSAGQRGTPGSKAWENGYDGDWMKKGNSTGDSMASLHTETLGKLKKMLGQDVNSPSVTLSGHSAGGLAVSNAIASGFKPDKIKFLDASYVGWASSAYEKVKGNKKTKVEIYVIKGTETDNSSTRSLKGKEGVKYVATNKHKHGDFISAYL